MSNLKKLIASSLLAVSCIVTSPAHAAGLPNLLSVPRIIGSALYNWRAPLLTIAGLKVGAELQYRFGRPNLTGLRVGLPAAWAQQRPRVVLIGRMFGVDGRWINHVLPSTNETMVVHGARSVQDTLNLTTLDVV